MHIDAIKPVWRTDLKAEWFDQIDPDILEADASPRRRRRPPPGKLGDSARLPSLQPLSQDANSGSSPLKTRGGLTSAPISSSPTRYSPSSITPSSASSASTTSQSPGSPRTPSGPRRRGAGTTTWRAAQCPCSTEQLLPPEPATPAPPAPAEGGAAGQQMRGMMNAMASQSDAARRSWRQDEANDPSR